MYEHVTLSLLQQMIIVSCGSTMRPFLTAEWRHLILLTYAVEPAQLEPYLPNGLVPDMIGQRAFVSLVAFDFLNTRVRGIPVPFHINFPEINLRCYVKYGEQRGVLFIREFVPRFCIAQLARRLYNEPYASIPMWSKIEQNKQQRIISHDFQYGGKEHSLKFTVENRPQQPKENSTAHFFKEHEWGFGTNKKGKLIRYKVEHPVWETYPVETRFHLDVDFGLLYGEQWRFLNNKIPYHLTVAKGSRIKVFPGEIINP